MNIQPTDDTQQTISSDDGELAKILAGVNDIPAPEEEPAPVAPEVPVAEAPADLSTIKTNAITDLKPLLDRINLPADEKFDVYMLIINSSHDRSLIEPAYNTARLIEDESTKAKALLDIIKEIDSFSDL